LPTQHLRELSGRYRAILTTCYTSDDDAQNHHVI
jgi:hypothetical protein